MRLATRIGLVDALGQVGGLHDLHLKAWTCKFARNLGQGRTVTGVTPTQGQAVAFPLQQQFAGSGKGVGQRVAHVGGSGLA